MEPQGPCALRCMSPPMDVDAPDRRIRSLKDFLAHVATVSLGIIIAFSFEGARDWWRNRGAVQEARANLRNEMRDNQHDLDASMQMVAQARQQLEQALAQVDGWRSRPEAIPGAGDEKGRCRMVLNFSTIFVDASRATAETTGALAHMPYAELNLLSETYNLQAEYQRRARGVPNPPGRLVPCR